LSRTILVGDVHGCLAELESLLDRVNFSTGDRLVLVGDLVARGPDSPGVLRIARETGALLVRGNHEDRVLTLATRNSGASPAHPTSEHARLANALSHAERRTLEQAPVMLHLAEHNLAVVHAGIDPSASLHGQRERDLLTLRTVASPKGPTLWGELYSGPTHIVFGHHALQGLQLHPFATGLDTGCVYGKYLTALVLEEAEEVPRTPERRRKKLVQVQARRSYFVPQKGDSDRS
jgi:diadenosine tetraphosphatase ApaH/serine/threonine PP2A family protein phosphatase